MFSQDCEFIAPINRSGITTTWDIISHLVVNHPYRYFWLLTKCRGSSLTYSANAYFFLQQQKWLLSSERKNEVSGNFVIYDAIISTIDTWMLPFGARMHYFISDIYTNMIDMKMKKLLKKYRRYVSDVYKCTSLRFAIN